MNTLNVLVKDDSKTLTSNSRLVYESKADAFFVFANLRELICHKILPPDFKQKSKPDSLKTDRHEFQIQIPQKENATYSHFYYNPNTHVVIFSDSKQIYVEKLYLKANDNSQKASFQTLGDSLGPRSIRTIKFHPLNGNVVGILYESNLFELYDLESDLEDPFLYKNFSSITRGLNFIVNFSFGVGNSKLATGLDDLRLFFYNDDNAVFSLYPVFVPGISLSEHFAETIDMIKDSLGRDDFGLIEQVESIKQAAIEIEDRVGENQLTTIADYNDLFNPRMELLEKLQSCSGSKHAELFEVMKISSLGKVLLMARQDSSEIIIEIFLCVFDLFDPGMKTKQTFVPLQKLKIKSEPENPVTFRYDQRSLFLLKKTKIMRINFDFLENLSYKMEPNSFQVLFANKLASSVSQIQRPNGLSFVDFKVYGHSLIHILAQNESKSGFQILYHDFNAAAKELPKEESEETSVVSKTIGHKFDQILAECKQLTFANPKQNAVSLDEYIEKIQSLSYQVNLHIDELEKASESNDESVANFAIIKLESKFENFKSLMSEAQGLIKNLAKSQLRTNEVISLHMANFNKIKHRFTVEEERITKEVKELKARQKKIEEKFESIFSKGNKMGLEHESKAEINKTYTLMANIQKELDSHQFDYEISIVL